LWDGPTPSPTSFGSKQVTFSPTSGYPSPDLYRCVYFVRAVNNGVHTFDHRLLQPALGLFASILVALDYYLVVTNEYRHGSWTLVPTLPQESQRQLQALGSCSLNRGVEAVG
jgi:hypothetical protein